MYGEGVSKTGELLDLGVNAGIVEKSGAWFSHDGNRIGQGRENAKSFLRQNPDVAQSIERKIRANAGLVRSEEHTSELQSLMRISYAVFCLKKKNSNRITTS